MRYAERVDQGLGALNKKPSVSTSPTAQSMFQPNSEDQRGQRAIQLWLKEFDLVQLFARLGNPCVERICPNLNLKPFVFVVIVGIGMKRIIAVEEEIA